MRRTISFIAGTIVIAAISACAEVPPETVAASRQIEKNLETLKKNNILLLDAWYGLSVDYWTEKVGREGADIILVKAKKKGKPINLNEDYQELVQQVLSEYRKNFLSKLNASYLDYRIAIENDYLLTIDANRKLTSLLQSVVKVDSERAALIDSISSELGVKEEVGEIQTELRKLAGETP